MGSVVFHSESGEDSSSLPYEQLQVEPSWASTHNSYDETQNAQSPRPGHGVTLVTYITEAHGTAWKSFYTGLAILMAFCFLIHFLFIAIHHLGNPQTIHIRQVVADQVRLPNGTLCFALFGGALRAKRGEEMSWATAEPILKQFYNRMGDKQIFDPMCALMPETSCVDECKQCTSVTCSNEQGRVYRGTKNTTINGVACQKWTVNAPHAVTLPWMPPPESYLRPYAGSVSDDEQARVDRMAYYDLGDHNFCRYYRLSPTDEDTGPWCYTQDPDIVWDHCFPTCGDDERNRASKVESCVDVEQNCYHWELQKCHHDEEYQGDRSVTISGVPCENWNDTAAYTNYAYVGEHNLCRNPDGEPAPWCYSTDPDRRWEFCFEPCKLPYEQCVTPAGCVNIPSYACVGDFYKGMKNTTASGRACQNWLVDKPHSHGFPIGNHSLCRNPDAEVMPWCYTTDSGRRWEFCFEACPDNRDSEGLTLLATMSEILQHNWLWHLHTANVHKEMESYGQTKYFPMPQTEDTAEFDDADRIVMYHMMDWLTDKYYQRNRENGIAESDMTDFTLRFQQEICKAIALTLHLSESRRKSIPYYFCDEYWSRNGVYLTDISAESVCFHLPLASLPPFGSKDETLEIQLSLGHLYRNWDAFTKAWRASGNRRSGLQPISLALGDGPDAILAEPLLLAAGRAQNVMVSLDHLFQLKSERCDDKATEGSWRLCNELCHARTLVTLCGLADCAPVTPPSALRVLGVERHCTAADLENCAEFTEAEFEALRSRCADGCRRPCQRLEYRVEAARNYMIADERNERTSKFVIDFRSTRYTIFEEASALSFSCFLSDVGGSVALFLSFGLATLVHLFAYLCRQIYQRIN